MAKKPTYYGGGMLDDSDPVVSSIKKASSPGNYASTDRSKFRTKGVKDNPFRVPPAAKGRALSYVTNTAVKGTKRDADKAAAAKKPAYDPLSSVKAPAASKSSYDPLSSVSANSPKKLVGTSPAAKKVLASRQGLGDSSSASSTPPKAATVPSYSPTPKASFSKGPASGKMAYQPESRYQRDSGLAMDNRKKK